MHNLKTKDFGLYIRLTKMIMLSDRVKIPCIYAPRDLFGLERESDNRRKGAAGMVQLSLFPSGDYLVYTVSEGYTFGYWSQAGRYMIVRGSYIKEEDAKKFGLRIGRRIKAEEF